MAGNLIIPRCQIYWGKTNLSMYAEGAFADDPQPLAYDAQVQMQESQSNPSGSFFWNPTGPAWDVYQKFISDKEKLNEQIVIRFFFANGKSIPFVFVWAGQQFSFGNDMNVQVTLKTELEGFTNANIRSIAQAYDKDATYLSAIDRAKKQYGLEEYKKLIRLSKQAEKDLGKATLKTYYAKDTTFGSAVSNLAEQNGNTVFANNIGQANNTILTPFTWEAKQKDSKVEEAKETLQLPDPTVRYGFLLGPGIVDVIQRTMEWVSPQATPEAASKTQTKANPKEPDKPSGSAQNPQSKPQEQAAATATATPSPLGTSLAAANPGVQNADNKDGPTKQNLKQKEGGSTLSAQMFLCPVLVGIKPGDIVYVPSLQTSSDNSYIEDWIVTSVSYAQSDGSVTVSINATRPYGLGTLMNEEAGKYWREKARTLKSLEDWGAYAWPSTLGGLPAV